MSRGCRPFRAGRQKGAVLFVALILLFILTLLGITAARMETAEERMAQNENNHQLALQAAETALRSAEGQLEAGLYSPNDFTANDQGLYDLPLEIQNGLSSSTPGPVSIVDSINWSKPGTSTKSYAGPALTSVVTPPAPAQFVIERLPPGTVLPGSPLYTPGSNQPTVMVYRITAHASGGDSSSAATVQSIVVLE